VIQAFTAANAQPSIPRNFTETLVRYPTLHCRIAAGDPHRRNVMCVAEWDSFVVAMQERKLPKISSLGTIQSQLHQLYKERTISREQWTEFEFDLHRLEPALPWLS
jgi:hypothetical protein